MKNYQLSIKLLEIEPPIWRRIAVPGTVSLAKLHAILQKVMGWENYHIYLFTAGRLQYGEGVSEWNEVAQRVVNAKRVMLQDIAARKGARFNYTYDMGDGWEHEIRVEEISEGEPEQVRCLEGARSCPRKIAVGRTVMRNYWKLSSTQSIRNIRNGGTGWARASTQNNLTWR